jgi:hypothetical protein
LQVDNLNNWAKMKFGEMLIEELAEAEWKMGDG